MLTNNEIKDIIKVISSLENKGILLKGTTKKVTNQKGGLAKSVLVPLGLTATDTTIQKKIFESGTTASIISNEEIDDIMKIVEDYGLFS